jgi:hypothetical protein
MFGLFQSLKLEAAKSADHLALSVAVFQSVQSVDDKNSIPNSRTRVQMLDICKREQDLYFDFLRIVKN